jgi:hypothetical protein
MTNLTSKLVRSSASIVLCAGLLLQAHSLFAAEPGDPLNQARAFLNPPVVSHATSAERVATAYSDAGEQLRAIILNRANLGGAQVPVAETALIIVFGGNRADTDPQDAMRQIIQGPGAPAIASSNITVSEGGTSSLR